MLSAALLLALSLPAAAATFEGFPSDLGDREQVELLADWGYFGESAEERARLDELRYEPMRERWRRVDSRTRRILRRAPKDGKAYQSVPAETQKLAEQLERWQGHLGIGKDDGPESVSRWRVELTRRRRLFESQRERLGLPERTHPGDIVVQEGDLDEDGRLETYAAYWVQPEDRITRSPSGELFLKGLLPGTTIQLGEFRLGPPGPVELAVLKPSPRPLLSVEVFSGPERRDSVVRAYSLQGGRLRAAALAGQGPLRAERRASSKAEFQGQGKTLVLSSEDVRLQDLTSQGVGQVKTSSRREYRWDGQDYLLSAGTDSARLSGTVLRGTGYSQTLPQGLRFSLEPVPDGWEAHLRSPDSAELLKAPVRLERAARKGETRALEFEDGTGALGVAALVAEEVEEGYGKMPEVLRADLSASTAAARGAVQSRSLLRLDFWAEFFLKAK